MQAVLIAMTILGCNDSVTQCNYVATVGKHFETVAMCDADSERQLKHYSNISYPTVIAVCEPPHPPLPPEPKVVAAAPAPAPAVIEEKPQTGVSGLASRMAAEVRTHLPSGHSMKSALATPVHFVTGSYSWVVRRLSN
ncbi:hypothetical protein ACIQUB_07555 [Rhizobium sp. NPDC090275]|uniref:hypothetical protein n=1 Tax=Rhizobium sp. NPDC090275 TaxID=3364498 RepID=UPI000DE0163C